MNFTIPTLPLVNFIDRFIDFTTNHFAFLTKAVSNVLESGINLLQAGLHFLPPWLIIIGLALIAWKLADRKVAIITSATGAALRDFLRVLRQRWPLVEVLLVPSLVQGAEAPASLRAALQQVYRRSDIDVIVLARGGGSMEDLWAFNDEALARLIAASPVPVVSGVGHETDFTIADFVADQRAPTPTAAAAAIVPDAATLRQNLDATIARLGEIVEQRLREQRVLVNHAVQRLAAQAPYQRLQQQRLLVNELQSRLWRVQQGTLQRQRLLLLGQQQQLQALNPRRVLARGYALVRDEDGHVIRSTSQISPDQPLSVEVSDGTFPVVVGKTTAETH